MLAAGQRFDIRVEATSDTPEPPSKLTVVMSGKDITSRNILDPGPNGERGSGGTGTAAPNATTSTNWSGYAGASWSWPDATA